MISGRTVAVVGLVTLCLVTLSACGGGGDSLPTSSSQPAPPPPPTPAVTAVGTVTGVPVTATIGAQGGTLKSADGSLTLTVPPGAVATNTQFSIQPITNLAPGGVSGGYRLLPEGQTFVAPIQLTWTYTDQDIAGSAPEALAVAFQDTQGRWNKPKAVSLDPATKTLKATTTHFSDWVRVRGFFLSPGSATVKVGNPVTLRVVFCDVVDEGGVVTLLAKCNPEDDDDLSSASGWSVNRVLGGEATVGTVKPVGTTGAAGTSAIYTAPSKVPSPALVEVSARLDAALSSTSLVAIIKVVEDVSSGYEGTVTFVVKIFGFVQYEGSADVVFERDINFYPFPAVAYRLVSGTLSLKGLVQSTPTCLTRYPVTTQMTAQNSGGQLTINYGTNPPTAEGFGSSGNFDIKLECTGAPPVTGIALIDWLRTRPGDLVSSADGSVLSGSTSFDDGGGPSKWTYSFHAVGTPQ